MPITAKHITDVLVACAEAGTPVVPARLVWQRLRRAPEFGSVLRAAKREGLVLVRRVHIDGRRRRTLLALPPDGHHLYAVGEDLPVIRRHLVRGPDLGR
jgi:hypothetical protein